MRAPRCGDDKNGSGSGVCASSGSIPLPLGSGTGRCTGADTSGMATSTQTASVAASFLVQVPGSEDVGLAGGGEGAAGVGDPIGDLGSGEVGRGEGERDS